MKLIYNFFALMVTLCFLFVANDIFAQSPSDRLETSDKMQQLQRVMEQYDDVDDDTGRFPESDVSDDDGDLGKQRIMRRRSRHKYYAANASLTLQSSDNANLAPNPSARTSDANRVASVSSGYHFNLPSPYTAQIRGSYQAVSYFDQQSLNYDYFSLSGNVRRRLTSRLGRTTLGLGYRYQNLLYGAENEANHRLDSVQAQHVFSGSLRQVYPLSRFQSFSGGISVEQESTDYVDLQDPFTLKREGGEFDPQKTRAMIDAMYRYQYSQKISFSSSYQFTRDWYQYKDNFGTTEKRRDYSHLISTGFRYRLTESLNLGLNLSYNENHSNFSSSEYDSFSGSFLLSTRTRF